MACNLWAEIAILCIALLLLISSLIFKNEIHFVKFDFAVMIALFIIVGFLLLLNNDILVNRFYLIDKLSVIIKVFVLLIGFCVYLLPVWTRYGDKECYLSYSFLAVMAIFGMNIVIIAKDLIVLYVGLEIINIAFYALMAVDRNNKFSLDASIKYFISSSFFSGIYIYGVSIVYVNYGSTEIPVDLFFLNINEPMLSLGLLMIVCGLLFKMGCAPFHMWTPDVYQGSPMFVTTLLSTASKIAIIAPLLHLVPFLKSSTVLFHSVFKFSGISSIILGSLAALYQSNIKRLIAFSSVAQMGYIILIIAFFLNNDLCNINHYFSVIMLYIFNYTIFTLGFLSFISLFANNNKNSSNLKLSDLRFFSQCSFTNMLVVVLLISVIAIPPLSGFFAKFYLLNLILENNPLTAIFLIIFIILSSVYYIRIVIFICFTEKSQSNVNLMIKKSMSWWLLFATSSLCLFFVFYGKFFMNFIQLPVIK